MAGLAQPLHVEPLVLEVSGTMVRLKAGLLKSASFAKLRADQSTGTHGVSDSAPRKDVERVTGIQALR